MRIPQNVLDYLEAPPVKVQAMLDAMSANEKHELSVSLAALLQEAAWKFGYADERDGYGETDRGHADGNRRANKMLTSVRKAMGYAYPDSAAINV